ncbi:MAG: response regulator [Bryobacteraceae bacterium]
MKIEGTASAESGSGTELLRRAVEAARTGNKPEARRLLAEAVRVDPNNEKAWLWRASLTVSRSVAAGYLHEVLRINPQNTSAMALLAKLGHAPPAPTAAQAEEESAETGGRSEIVVREQRVLALGTLGAGAPPAEANGHDQPAQTVEAGEARTTAEAAIAEPNGTATAVEAPEIRVSQPEPPSGTAFEVGLTPKASVSAALAGLSAAQFPQRAAAPRVEGRQQQAPAQGPPAAKGAASAFAQAARLATSPGQRPAMKSAGLAAASPDAAGRAAVSPDVARVQRDLAAWGLAPNPPAAAPAPAEPAPSMGLAQDGLAPAVDTRRVSAGLESLPSVGAAPSGSPASKAPVAPPIRKGEEDAFRPIATPPPPAPRRTPEQEAAQYAGLLNPKTCPFCRERRERQDFCMACRAFLSLRQDMMYRSDGRDDAALMRTIDSLQDAPGAERSFEAQYVLALANLNLANTSEATIYLARACRLRPGLESLRTYLNALRARPLILVVDDSLTIRTMVATALEGVGYRVLRCASATDALNAIKQETPRLALLDVSMPMVDGFQLCRMMRSIPSTKDIPILMLSGHDGFLDKVKGRMAGATDYLTKPFDPEPALAKVGKLVRL